MASRRSLSNTYTGSTSQCRPVTKGRENKYAQLTKMQLTNYQQLCHDRNNGRAMDYDLDLEPLAFTIDEYNERLGIVDEILKTGIEI